MRGTRIFSGSRFEEQYGYARAVVLPDPGGDWILVSGTTGFDYQVMTIAEDAAEQTRQCFRNLARALAEAGATLDDAVRLRIFFPEPGDWAVIGPIVGEQIAGSRPASTAVVAALVDPRMKVEVEVTARKAPRRARAAASARRVSPRARGTALPPPPARKRPRKRRS